MQYVIPDAVRWRKDKLGFAPPQDKWMHKFSVSSDSRLQQEGYALSESPWRNYIAEVFLKVAKEKF